MKIKFWPKIEILSKNRFFFSIKMEFLPKHLNFVKKYLCFLKMKFSAENQIWQTNQMAIVFFVKIEFLAENRNFAKKSLI